MFYGLSTLFRSFRARSVNLSTLFLGRPPRQFTSAHSFASNWQLPFLNQRKGENGRRNYFMTNFNERMLPVVRIEPTTVRIPGGRGSDRATAPGLFNFVNAEWYIYQWISWSLVTYEMVYVPLSLAVVYIPLCYHNMPSPEWYIYQWMNWRVGDIRNSIYNTFGTHYAKPRVLYRQ